MPRKPQIEKLERIYRAVETHPGKRPCFIARLLGEHRSQITRALPAMQDHGYLLSEDERGGLWPFRKSRR